MDIALNEGRRHPWFGDTRSTVQSLSLERAKVIYFSILFLPDFRLCWVRFHFVHPTKRKVRFDKAPGSFTVPDSRIAERRETIGILSRILRA